MRELHPVDLLARHLRVDWIPEAEIREEICYVTGRKGPCLPREYAISEAYTDMRFCAAPLSPWVGVEVVHAWKAGSRPEGKKRVFCPERQSSWYVDEQEFRMLRREDVLQLLLNGAPRVPWAGWFTEKYRKHGSVRTQINYEPYGVWGYDERRVDASNHQRVLDLYERMLQLARAGVQRDMLLYQNLPVSVISRIGIATYQDLMMWLSKHRHSALFRMLLALVPSREFGK